MDTSGAYNLMTVRLHVVALKAFLLGSVFLAGVIGTVLSPANSAWYRVSIYTMANTVFHMLEFLTTAKYNPGEVDDDSFILGDKDLYYVYGASLMETCLSHRFWSYSTTALVAGLLVVLAGQTCRTVAMYTAGESFNHYVQRQRAHKHKLVTSGIYRHLRHPSYFGYFWWFLGMQLVLENWFMALAGGYKLYSFFKARIEFEERFLRSFFGEDYSTYAASTPVGIPGIA